MNIVHMQCAIIDITWLNGDTCIVQIKSATIENKYIDEWNRNPTIAFNFFVLEKNTYDVKCR